MEETGTITLIMNNADLATYQVVLQTVADIMRALINTNGQPVLLYITAIVFMLDIFMNRGDFRRIKLLNYVAIVAMVVALLSSVVDMRIINYDPVSKNSYGNGTQSFATVQNMPYAPAIILKLIFDIDYHLAVIIDKNFYKARNLNVNGVRGKFFDKVEEYTDLIAGKIDDPHLSMQVASFIKNIFLSDLYKDVGGRDINFLKNNNMENILARMYLGESTQIDTIADISNHAEEPLYLVNDDNKLYVVNDNMMNEEVRKKSYETIGKGSYYRDLRNALSGYYESEIEQLARNKPGFYILQDYENTRKKVKEIGGDLDKLSGLPMRDFLLAAALNYRTKMIKDTTDVKDVFTLSSESVIQTKTALIKAEYLKLYYVNFINIVLLVLVFMFPVVYIMSFVPNFLGFVKQYYTMFLVMAFASPLGYFLECVTDVFTSNNIAMKIAGSMAGLSPVVQDSMMNFYNTMPMVTTLVYTGALGIIFSLGNRTLSVIGTHLMSSTTESSGRDVPDIMRGNASYGSRSYDVFNAMASSGVNDHWGTNTLLGYDMVRAGNYLHGLNTGTLKDDPATLRENGLTREDGKWELNDPVKFASYLKNIDDMPGHIMNSRTGQILGADTLSGVQRLSYEYAPATVLERMNAGKAADYRLEHGYQYLQSFSTLIDSFTPNKVNFSRNQDLSVDAQFSAGSSLGFNTPFGGANFSGSAMTANRTSDHTTINQMDEYNKLKLYDAVRETAKEIKGNYSAREAFYQLDWNVSRSDPRLYNYLKAISHENVENVKMDKLKEVMRDLGSEIPEMNMKSLPSVEELIGSYVLLLRNQK